MRHFKKPNPDSQNLKNECTLCWTIGIYKRVLHCESEGKYGMEQKSGVSLDTAGEGRSWAVATADIKSREQEACEIVTPSGQTCSGHYS